MPAPHSDSPPPQPSQDTILSSASLSSAVPLASSEQSSSVSSLQLPHQLPSHSAPPVRRHLAKIPLSSSARCKKSLTRPSSLSTTITTTTELEHGFTSDEDFVSAPLLSDLTLRSLAGAPMPALHEPLAPQPLPSDRASPSQPDHLSPNPTHELHSSSSRLSKPSKLSDENLQRQSTGIKERVKRSVKMRETERWARETASSSQHSSSPRLQPASSPATQPVHANNQLPEAQDQNLFPLSPSQLTTYTHACPSPETLPRPRLSVQPVSSFRAIAVSEPGTECVIPSEHATVNDWQSENTNATHLAGAPQLPTRTIFPLSPIDVQFIGQTPTSNEFQSFNQMLPPMLPPPILPGTVIGSADDHMGTSHIIPIPFSPFLPLSDHRPSKSPPRIEEIPPTSPIQVSQEPPNSLVQARINLQQALSTTPLARSSPGSNLSPSTLPIANDPRQSACSPAHSQRENEMSDDDDDNDDNNDDDPDNESGLSPIKEDRTAELAAEHSWKIHKQMLSSPNPRHNSPKQPVHQPKSSVSMNLLHHIESGGNQPAPQRCKSESTIAAADVQRKSQISVKTQSTPSATLISLQSDHGTTQVAQSSNSNDAAGSSPQGSEPRSNLGESKVNKDLLTGSNLTADGRLDHLTSSHPVISAEEAQPPKPQSQSPNLKEAHSEPILVSSTQPSVSSPPQARQPAASADQQSLLSRREVSSRNRNGSHQRANPPLSIPASARRPPPEDLLSRLEMEEWRSQTGIDDRYSLSLRPINCSSSFASGSGSLPMHNALDEERRGIKDRWGNSWGLESHILSPLSEHTELTTVGSILSLSTRKSNHSLGSLDSTSNSIAQRLEQADSNPMRMMKLGTTLLPGGVINVSHRPIAGPINRIDSPTKVIPATRTDSNKEVPSPTHPLLLEEKLKRREERRLRRERREKRRAQELKSSENLAHKQERRRMEKKKKEEFLEKKHQILQRLHETGEDAKVVRDLGILYMSSNVGVAGLKLAIRHLETSLQMDDSDPLSWSCLGKTWAQLYGMPESETPKTGNFQEATKAQQAHNATIGLRKAIINSRTYAEVIKYKIEWARFLEKVGRWRDSLGLIGELLKNLGKSEFKCWANLGFTGLRIVFGWPPLSNLEVDDLEQGFIREEEDEASINFFASKNRPENLSESDCIKLLVQVRNAFDRAVTLIDEQIVSHHLTRVNRGYPVPAGDHQIVEVESIDRLKAYKNHYQLQLNKVHRIEKQLEQQDAPGPSSLIRDHAPHMSLSSTEDPTLDSNQASNVDSGADTSREAGDTTGGGVGDTTGDGADTTRSVAKDGGEDPMTEEIHSIALSSQSSSPAPPAIPILDPHREAPPHKVPIFVEQAPPPNCLGLSNPVSKSGEFGVIPAQSQCSQASSIPIQSKEPPSSSNAKHFFLPDGDVSSSEGPEIIVQYDDVDTTNDYSERSRNSEDPFRASPSLGQHHFIRHPFLTSQPQPLDQPDLAQHASSSQPDLAQHGSPLAGQQPNENSKSSNVEEVNRHSDDKTDPNLPAGDNLPQPSLGEEIDGAPKNEAELLPQSSSTVRNVVEQPAAAHDEHLVPSSSVPLQTPAECIANSSAEHSAGLVDEHQQPEPTFSHETPLCDQQIEGDRENPPCDEPIIDNSLKLSTGGATEEGHHENSQTPEKLPCSINVMPNSENALHHKISNMGLSTPVQHKLRALDKEKLIAFLEIDSAYHSKISKLRRELIKIEEERELKRKEIFEKLGIIKFYDNEQEREANQTDWEELEEERSVEKSGFSPLEENNQILHEEAVQEGDNQMEERTKADRQQLGSSMSSIRSASSVPTRSKLRHHRQQPTTPLSKEFIPGSSRSVCSPPHRNNKNSSYLRGRAFSLNGLGVETPHSVSVHSHNNHHGADMSCNSTAVNDTGVARSIGIHSPVPPPPGSSDSNQANIALQGIAAILKLATSTQPN